jgi:hypothetical protein
VKLDIVLAFGQFGDVQCNKKAFFVTFDQIATFLIAGGTK